MSKLQWIWSQFIRRHWIRAALFAVLAVASSLVAVLLGPLLPGDLGTKIGADAVDAILTILASSMLAVTTFSLQVMVSAYSSATSNVSPRAVGLLIQDTTTQNVLATFLGTFLFSLVGIIALNTGIYGANGRVVLFVVTLAVIVVIVATFLRWIDHLLHFGRVAETTQVVANAASEALRARRRSPHAGGVPFPPPFRIPGDAKVVRAHNTGYIRHVDMGALQRAAKAAGGQVFLAEQAGAFVHPAAALAWFTGGSATADDISSDIRAAYSIGPRRSFDQDPRFGLSVMAEIASRALSPAVNDPGTAIDVIAQGVRVLTVWSADDDSPDDAGGEGPEHPDVHVPPLSEDDFFDDLFAPIARDGAGTREVVIRLLKALDALARIDPRRFGRCTAHQADRAVKLAEAALVLPEDREEVRRLADLVHGKAP